jgi:hypothetical protein
MREALRAYRSLSDEQRQIIEQKVVTIERPAAEAIALLQGIAACDAAVAKTRQSAGCSIGAVAIIALVSIFLIVGIPFIGIPLLLLCIGGVIPAIRLYRWAGRVDVSDNLRNTAMPVLAVLRDDLDPQQPLKLTLDLRQPNAPEKLKERKPETKVGGAKIRETFYEDAWIAAEATLVDGSRLRWSVSDTVRERHKSYKSRSGKYKTKTKIARKSDIEVQLTIRGKSYAVADGEKKETRHARRVVKTAGALDPGEVLAPIAELFAGVQPAGGTQ